MADTSNKLSRDIEYSVTLSGVKSGTLENRSCVLPISMPLHPYTESWLGSSEAEKIKR